MQTTSIKSSATGNQQAGMELAKACGLLILTLLGSIGLSLWTGSTPQVTPPAVVVPLSSAKLSSHPVTVGDSGLSSELQVPAAEVELSRQVSAEFDADNRMPTVVVEPEPAALAENRERVQAPKPTSGFKSGEDYWRDDSNDMAAHEPVAVTVNDPSVWR